MSTRVEILILAFTIIGLFGLSFWLVMFRLWIARFPGLGMARLLIEGLGIFVTFIQVWLLVQAVSLIWSGKPIGALTQASVILSIGVFSWIQVGRFTWWWIQQAPHDTVAEIDDELSAEVDPDDLG